MSRKFLFDSRFWNDPWVVDNLSIVERHLFFYLFSNEHANIAGVYEISLRTIANETGFEREEVIRMMQRLEPKIKYINGWVVVRNAVKNQNYRSPDTAKGIMRIVESCPRELVEYVNWPDDFGNEKPKGSDQMQLIEADLEQLFGSAGVEKNSTVEKKAVEENSTTQGVGGGLATAPTTVPIVNLTSETIVSTAGKKKEGQKYTEANVLFDDLGDLVNEGFREWYCKQFYRLGHERVLFLASQARADGKNPKRLFSKLLKDEESKQGGKIAS